MFEPFSKAYRLLDSAMMCSVKKGHIILSLKISSSCL